LGRGGIGWKAAYPAEREKEFSKREIAKGDLLEKLGIKAA